MRSLMHFVLSLVAWSTFCAALTALSPHAVTHETSSPRDGVGVRNRVWEYTNGRRDERVCENVLATSDSWVVLGCAARDSYERNRREIGDELARERVRTLLAGNGNVSNATVEKPYVHVTMPNRPDYYILLGSGGEDCRLEKAGPN